jgi:hypothetical protein
LFHKNIKFKITGLVRIKKNEGPVKEEESWRIITNKDLQDILRGGRHFKIDKVA